MAKSNKQTAEYKIVSLRRLSESSGVPYGKLWGNLTGRVNTLDANERTAIANAAHAEMAELFSFFGFEVNLKRIPKNGKA